MSKIYKFINKKTNETLNQFIARGKDPLITIDEFSCYRETTSFQKETITPVISEKGTPGFMYYIPYEGMNVVWLSRKHWRVEYNLKEC